MLDVAKAYRDAGLSCLPIAPGFKSPSVVSSLNGRGINISWNIYRDKPASDEILESWFGRQKTMGIGLVTGYPANGVGFEILDIDNHETLQKFNDVAPQELLGKLVYEVTPGGGGHYGYLCTEYTRNLKLAQTVEEGKVKTLIETRGQGGQAVVSPTGSGIHPEYPDRAYELVRGSWLEIPTISPEDRQILHGIARLYNDIEEGEIGQNLSPWKFQGRPGDTLNTQANAEWWEELLTRFGWCIEGQRNGVVYWRRPGKDSGCSATYGACGRYFYVFSTNAYPFVAGRGYSPFSAYGLLKFGGDYHKAAASLGE